MADGLNQGFIPWSAEERQQAREELLRSRKLALILDLDQTLVHAMQAEKLFSGPAPVIEQVPKFIHEWKMVDPKDAVELFAITVERGSDASGEDAQAEKSA